MPGDLDSPSELCAALADPERIRSQEFEILQHLCRMTSSNDEQGAQDMVLRALEMREHFVTCREILDGLVRHFGLFQYLEPADLPFLDQIAYEVHRPANLEDDIVFHRPQAEVYWTLLAGESVVLSAPTSFGKSLIIDAVIASLQYRNILIVVPTIALIDETRRRLARLIPRQLQNHHARLASPSRAKCFDRDARTRAQRRCGREYRFVCHRRVLQIEPRAW
jgi:DEAD/DEAH box helicase